MAEGTRGGTSRTRIVLTAQDEALLATMRGGLKRLELSPHTIRLYTSEISIALRWGSRHGFDLVTIHPDDFERYVKTRPRSHPTKRAMRTAFKHFWSITGRADPPLWLIRVPRKPRMQSRAFGDPEAARITERALTVGGKPGAAAALALFNAMRREEIATARRDGVDDEGWISFIGKGNKPATLPLHPYARVLLDSIPDEGSPWYFPGDVDGHVHPAVIWTWITELTAADGTGERRAPHVLRHTALAKANDETGDLRATQEFARHERPETTAGYTRASRQRMLMVMSAIDYGVAS